MKKIIILLFILTNILFASIGQITALVGDIKISRDSKEIQAKLGEKLEKNDVINSAKASKAQVTLDDNTIITIGQNSSLNIFDYAFDETKPKEAKASFGFMKGSFKSITGKIGRINKERFKLKTKSASIGIRGTTIIGNQKMIAVTDGAISVTANGVTVFVEKQQFTQTPEGAAPTPAQTLTPETLDTLEEESNGGDTGGNTEGEDDSGNDEGGNDNGGGGDTPPDEPNDSGGGGGGDTPPDNDPDLGEPIIPIVPKPELPEDPLDIPTPTDSNNRTYTGKQLSGTTDYYVDPQFKLNDVEGTYTNSELELTKLSNIFNSNDELSTNLIDLTFDNPATTAYSTYGLKSQSLIIDSVDYNLVADNLGEFLLAYYTNAGTYSSGLLYAGTEVDMSAFDLSKIYIYKDYKSLELGFNTNGDLTSSVLNDSNGNIYLNNKTKSMTYFNVGDYKSGAKYDAGYLDAKGNVTFKNIAKTSSYHKTGETEGKIYGSSAQGIGYTGATTYTTGSIESTGETNGGGYLSSSYTNTHTSAQNQEMTGKSVKLFEDATSTDFFTTSLSVRQSNGDITANLGEGSGNFSGTVSNGTSYYIDEDLFGVVNSSKDLFMMALPDSVVQETKTEVINGVETQITSDVIRMVDDESSWGYWTSIDGNNVSNYSTWVSGVETSSSYINTLKESLDTVTTASYKGHVLGAVKNGTNIDAILFNSSNFANFNINFGGGANNMTGAIGFETEAGQTWAASIGLSGITSTGFDSESISGTVNGTGTVTGYVDGKYYGTDSLKSIGGTFSLVSGSDNAVGVFKSTLDNITTTSIGQVGQD